MTGSYKVKSLIVIQSKEVLALLNVEREIYRTVYNLKICIYLYRVRDPATNGTLTVK